MFTEAGAFIIDGSSDPGAHDEAKFIVLPGQTS